MFDINWIRNNPQVFDEKMKMRGLEPMAQKLIELDNNRRATIKETEELQSERNKKAKEIGILKAKGEDASQVIADVALSKEKQAKLEEQVLICEKALNDSLIVLPNMPLDDVPFGVDENDNVEVKRVGEPKVFDFPVQAHDDIGKNLSGNQMDFERAAKLSGSRFVVLKQNLAKLERALANFMLDVHTSNHGFSEVTTPVLVKEQALYGSGQFPKFMEDVYQVDNHSYYMIPTSEVTLVNLHADEILPAEELPKRITSYSNCFRAEAGSAGRDTKGMIRQHQFGKVELVSLCTEEQGEAELNHIVSSAEKILQLLKLPYRVMLLCSQDMGAGARKTFDIEVWLPSQNCYREISSCSYCGDYQARRMMGRYRHKGEKKTSFLHTLNGSGLAVGRTMVAIIENYQTSDGKIIVPEALQPYMNGTEIIA